MVKLTTVSVPGGRTGGFSPQPGPRGAGGRSPGAVDTGPPAPGPGAFPALGPCSVMDRPSPPPGAEACPVPCALTPQGTARSAFPAVRTGARTSPFTQDWGPGTGHNCDISALFLLLCRGFCASTSSRTAPLSKSSGGEKAGGPLSQRGTRERVTRFPVLKSAAWGRAFEGPVRGVVGSRNV